MKQNGIHVRCGEIKLKKNFGEMKAVERSGEYSRLWKWLERAAYLDNMQGDSDGWGNESVALITNQKESCTIYWQINTWRSCWVKLACIFVRVCTWVYVCVCLLVSLTVRKKNKQKKKIYTYICVCVCVSAHAYVCVCVCSHLRGLVFEN